MNPGYYIYYRVAPEHADEAKRMVIAIQDDLYRDTGVRGALLCRRDDALTWMETYEGMTDEQAFVRELAAAVDRRGFAHVLAAGSHRVTEVFATF